MDLLTLGMMKNLGGGGSNIIIIDNICTDNATMTVNGQVFPLYYEVAEDWHPVVNLQLFTILTSMIPNNMPTIYFREVDNYGTIYRPWGAEITISEKQIRFDNNISISKEPNPWSS